MNIYMTALFDLHNGDFPYYQECYERSKESVFKFLEDMDDHILISGDERSPFDMLQKVYYQTIDEVRRGHDVLFIEIDALMIKPSKLFVFDKMKMFSRTNPPAFEYGGRLYDPYLNSGIRYFPATIPESILQTADQMIKNYDTSFWGYDQVVYNWMYYQQHEVADLSMEKYNFMPFPDVVSGINPGEAHILHFFSSRGARDCWRMVQSMSDRYVRG